MQVAGRFDSWYYDYGYKNRNGEIQAVSCASSAQAAAAKRPTAPGV
jgi:hypothetical protein